MSEMRRYPRRFEKTMYDGTVLFVEITEPGGSGIACRKDTGTAFGCRWTETELEESTSYVEVVSHHIDIDIATAGVFHNAGEDRSVDANKTMDDGLNGLQVHDIVKCPQSSRAIIAEITHDHEGLVRVVCGDDGRFSGWCRPHECELLERSANHIVDANKMVEAPSKITQQLCDLLIERDAKGRAKYGTTLDRTDLTAAEWNQHRLEELLDAIGYCMAERGAIERLAAERDELRLERDAANQELQICRAALGIGETDKVVSPQPPTWGSILIDQPNGSRKRISPSTQEAVDLSREVVEAEHRAKSLQSQLDAANAKCRELEGAAGAMRQAMIACDAHDGNCPGHAHQIRERWDESNNPCERCIRWNAALSKTAGQSILDELAGVKEQVRRLRKIVEQVYVETRRIGEQGQIAVRINGVMVHDWLEQGNDDAIEDWRLRRDAALFGARGADGVEDAKKPMPSPAE